MLIGFAAALLLSRVRLNGLHAPLALGLLLAAEWAGVQPAGIAGGVVIGSFLGETPMWPTLAASVLFRLLMSVLSGLGKKPKQTPCFLLFAAVLTAVLPLNLLFGAREILYGVIALACALLSAFGFYRALRIVCSLHTERVLTDAEQTVLAVGIGCILLSVSDISAFGWSPSVMLLILLTAVFVSVRGVFGAAAATLWASMLVLYAHADPVLIGAVALAALIASVLRQRGRPFVIVSFFLSAVLFRTYAAESALSVNVPNLIGGVLIYFLLPKAWIERLRQMTDADTQAELRRSTAISRIENSASDEIERMGKLLHGFSGVFRSVMQEEDAVDRWTVQGALTICNGCEVRRICWKDAERMRKTIVHLAAEAEAGKRLEPIDPIDPGCRHFGDLCGTVLLARQQAADRNTLFERAREQSGFAEKQFTGAGDALCSSAQRLRSRERGHTRQTERILERLTEAGAEVESVDWYEVNGADALSVVLRRPLRCTRDDVRNEIEKACGFRLRCMHMNVRKGSVRFQLEQDAQMHASVRISRKSEESAVSGDATGECRLSNGRVCFALSDGMGRGSAARAESEAAIDLLFNLYRAGMQKELIYDNVNRMLMVRNEAEMYATLDAVSIDLNTGEAELLKYGAPPSFLLRGEQIETIRGEALPCGILAEAKPSVIRLKLQMNDRLVLCSDGVQDALPDGPEQVLKHLAASDAPMDEVLLKLAESRGGTDDMTVMVIRVA